MIVKKYVIRSRETAIDYQCVLMTLDSFRLGGALTGCAHVVMISINHHLLISRPLLYYQIFSRSKVCIALALLWILPTAASMTYLSAFPRLGFRSPDGLCSGAAIHHNFTYRISVSSFILASIAVTFLIYISMLRSLKNRRLRFAKQSSKALSLRLKKRRQMLLTVLYVWLAFLIGWMPACIFTALFCFSCPFHYIIGDGDVLYFRFSVVAGCCILLKGLVNPFIYALRIPEIAADFKRLFRLKTADSQNRLSGSRSSILLMFSKAGLDKSKVDLITDTLTKAYFSYDSSS
ncbi:unnamed protein product [Soboliphyme baturini]|uniref:G_PROTEIN_RECEP_F1_2 domain-containing protein n=1 Tax=Soboliphyme baturini TaxID=241478 RepID=A0A183IKK1_9BILA|nr:unnamed protein product [Soboliphyme baturini]